MTSSPKRVPCESGASGRLRLLSPFTLRISPQAPDGNRYPIVDGGFTDWTARLLGNKKERLLISGIGSEFVCKTYRSA